MKVNIKDIDVGKRFREDFGNIEELAESIKQRGQIVPVIITSEKKLIDGERRIKAVELLGGDSVECVEFNTGDIKDTEVAANRDRKNWDIIEAVAIWNAMESYEWGKLPSESDGIRSEGVAKN